MIKKGVRRPKSGDIPEYIMLPGPINAAVGHNALRAGGNMYEAGTKGKYLNPFKPL